MSTIMSRMMKRKMNELNTQVSLYMADVMKIKILLMILEIVIITLIIIRAALIPTLIEITVFKISIEDDDRDKNNDNNISDSKGKFLRTKRLACCGHLQSPEESKFQRPFVNPSLDLEARRSLFTSPSPPLLSRSLLSVPLFSCSLLFVPLFSCFCCSFRFSRLTFTLRGL